MANKYSTLLNNLLKKTYADAKEKGHSEATFEDYLSRLFTVLNNYRPPMRSVPGELRGILGVREELDAVIRKASARSFDFSGMTESFFNFDKEHPETRANREQLFKTLLDFACTIAPERATTADDLWDAMVAYPSSSVKQFIFGEAPTDGEVAPPDPSDIWRGTIESEGGSVDTAPTTPTDGTDTISWDDLFGSGSSAGTDAAGSGTDSAGSGSGTSGTSGGKDDIISILDSIISGNGSGSGSSGAGSGARGTGSRGGARGTGKGPSSPVKEPTNLTEVIEQTLYVRDRLLENVLGQNAAIDNFIGGYFKAEAAALTKGEKKRPRATFLFAGPPGVGKTLLAEQVAQHTGLPYKRFDMSAFSDKEATIPFAGSDKVYSNGKPGLVTSFVAKNPRCILLFDEIEKAHINVIYLFLQMLDAGRLRDTYTEEDVPFTDAIIILTTNAGRNLYLDPTVVNLSSIPRRRIIRALEDDKSEADSTKSVFPSALISRFASGNIVMFNHLEAYNLSNIANKELISSKSIFSQFSGIDFTIDPSLGNALLLSEGARSDARTVSSRARNFFYAEIYELLRLVRSTGSEGALSRIRKINFRVSIPESGTARRLFVNEAQPTILIFGSKELIDACRTKLTDCTVLGASTVEEAREILFENDVTLALSDVRYGIRENGAKYINLEDVTSDGIDFIHFITKNHDTPVFIVAPDKNAITDEELLSFESDGVRAVITLDRVGGSFAHKVMDKCLAAYQQKSLLELARASKVLTYKTAQTLSDDGSEAEIHLFDMSLALAPDASDTGSLLVSKPNVRFKDVIGAEDAKAELQYFVEYMKSPVKYIRRGLRAPKGILLYGPPGTGKTMLAKAMAGESDVTFIATEGNAFLKSLVGKGSESVHELFATARKYAPSILFIDEIDAIAQNRSSDSAKHTGDILTAFLAEMDGFSTDSTKPVFVLAATNYDAEATGERSLDPAILRRFDRKLLVDLPNKEERERYIRLKMKKHPVLDLTDDKVANLAMRATGMSLAELESVIELAMRNAVRSQNLVIDDAALDEAFETFTCGEEKRWSEESLMRTARHEAGHALLCWLSGDKPSYVTVVARGEHGGYMQHADNEGKAIFTKNEMLARIRTSLAGRAAEIVYYGEEDGVSTGASGDLINATHIAESMVCRTGMDRSFGLAVLTPENMPYYYSEVRTRVNSILQNEYEKAIRIIENNRAAIDALCEALFEKNHLVQNEIDEIFRKYTEE